MRCRNTESFNKLWVDLKNGNRKRKRKEYDFAHGLDFEGEYLNRKRIGKGKEYVNGKLSFDGEYLNGKRIRKGKKYLNGKLRFESEYLNGKRNGNRKEYNIFKFLLSLLVEHYKDE